MYAVAVFGIPIIGSFLALVADRISTVVRNALAIVTVACTFIAALALIPLAGQARELVMGAFLIPGLELRFIVDGLGVFTAITSSFVGLLIAIYSLDYMKDYEHQGEYTFLVVLFLGAMMGLVLSANLLLMYVFWEITAICSWRLIGFYRKWQHLRNADTALMITVSGSFCMLAGLEMIWHETGTLNLTLLHGHPVSNLALLLIFLGILAKSAQVPLHIWLPSAGVAPSTVTALLHAAVLVVIGVFAFARIFVGTLILPSGWQMAVMIVAVATILVSGGAALVEQDAKRVLAYSTIAQLAIILLGLAGMSSLTIAGALIFLLAHSLAKAGLFLCVGIIEQQTHTRDLRELGGLARSMPITMAAFILCSITIAGFPPTAGFLGKTMIILGLAESSHFAIAALALLGSLLTLMYMVRLFTALFLGEERWPDVQEKTPAMLAVVGTLAGVSLAAGLAAGPLLNAINAVVLQILGG